MPRLTHSTIQLLRWMEMLVVVLVVLVMVVEMVVVEVELVTTRPCETC